MLNGARQPVSILQAQIRVDRNIPIDKIQLKEQENPNPNKGGLMRLLFVAIFVVASLIVMVSAGNAMDPSGIWTIEGRVDARLEVKCQGDTCQGTFQSAYGKFKAVGYFRENKLALVYNYFTPVASDSFGFLVYEMQNNSVMLKKAYDLNGKAVGGEKWIRQ